MSDYVPKRLRTAIARRANGRCEYCGSPANFCIDPFVTEHIYPVAKGGLTVADNLAFACMGTELKFLNWRQFYDRSSTAL